MLPPTVPTSGLPFLLDLVEVGCANAESTCRPSDPPNELGSTCRSPSGPLLPSSGLCRSFERPAVLFAEKCATHGQLPCQLTGPLRSCAALSIACCARRLCCLCPCASTGVLGTPCRLFRVPGSLADLPDKDFAAALEEPPLSGEGPSGDRRLRPPEWIG